MNNNPMSEEEKHENLNVKLDYIQRDIKDIKDSLKSDYVKKDEFLPVKNIVYGMVGMILVAVVGALITLVIRQQ